MKTFEELYKKSMDGISFPPITDEQNKNEELTIRINLLAYEEELRIRAQDPDYYKKIKDDDDKEGIINLRIEHIKHEDDMKTYNRPLVLKNYFDKNKKRAYYDLKSPFITLKEAKKQTPYFEESDEEVEVLEKEDEEEIKEGCIDLDGELKEEKQEHNMQPFGLDDLSDASPSNELDGDDNMRSIKLYVKMIDEDRDKVHKYICGIKTPYNKKTIAVMMLLAGATAASAIMFSNHIYSSQPIDDNFNNTTISPSVSHKTLSPTDKVTLSPTQGDMTHSPTFFNTLSPTVSPTVEQTQEPTPSGGPDYRCDVPSINPVCCDAQTREWRCD